MLRIFSQKFRRLPGSYPLFALVFAVASLLSDPVWATLTHY
jgi:hypothetical protein